MRFGKTFVFLLVGSLAISAAARAQVSDSDFFQVVPAAVNVAEDANSNFSVVIHMNNKTTAQSLTIPLTFVGANKNLRIDTLINDGFGNLGIRQKASGANATWTIRSSLVNNANQTILIGYVSFGLGLGASNDSLVSVHFDLDLGGGNAVHPIDSTLLPPANQLRITDPLANDIAPQWTPGAISIGTIGIGDGSITPLVYSLGQNHPNPFNAQTRIHFSLAAPGKIDLRIFNLLGQTVKVLVDKEMSADRHSLVWDGTNAQGQPVASGTYFYRLRIGDSFEASRQMVLLK